MELIDTDEDAPEVLHTSFTEMFLDKYFGKEIMSKEGRAVILFVYAVMIVFGIYGASQLEVDFKIEYFVDKESAVWGYLDANTEYFNNGESFTIYVENPDLNYASKET